MKVKTVVTNRKAYRDYEFLEKYEAGIALKGSEVKSLRGSKASLQDSYCKIDNGEIYIYNLYISSNSSSGYGRFEPTRKRKLLLHKAEINRLFGKTTGRGLTIIPTEIYFNNRGFAKVNIALAKKRKGPDKREILKRRDLERELRMEGRRGG
ncbi:MAG: SsrA-binding protein SmpB [Elusimicrobiota bacterium]|nr:SsrA-binding protein SmpB [Elusimicrobiota bacterium]